MDFTVALLLFIFTLVVYFSYTTNSQKQEETKLELMLTDARAISSSLVLSGYPTDWDNTSVVRIGIADEQKLNVTKLKSFKQINYSITKNRFGTIYDYFVFFVNDKGEVLNINGICGVGNQNVNVTYNVKSAYYYSDQDDSFLKDFMNETFNADIYFDDQMTELVNNLDKYDLVVLEHPLFTPSQLNTYYRPLNNFTARGGFFMVSGELVTAEERYLNGILFNKSFGQSSSQKIAIVNNTDQYLTFNVGGAIQFDQYYYVVNSTSPPIETNPASPNYNPVPAVDFKRIATFNQTDNKAIAKWAYGNGTVYFFSDFNANYFSGNFIAIVKDLATSFIEGTCTPINILNLNQKNLVKTERYLNHNSKVVKMVVYLWL